MLGLITLLIALFSQVGFTVFCMVTKSRQTKARQFLRITAFTMFSLLLIVGVYEWGFRWMGLFALLFVCALFSVVNLLRKTKKEKPYKGFPTMLSCICGCILLTFCILPGILFPQVKPVKATGVHTIETMSATWVDSSRVDPYKTGENRKLTVQFWYPVDGKDEEKYPLVMFSHGAFGYRGSNRSTFEDLASNGYVVCSIDHSSHAFFAKHTDGSMALADQTFLNQAVDVENGVYDEQKTYEITKGWLALRIADANFVLNEIEKEVSAQNGAIYSKIDLSKIGLFGHSLGGATAAQLGRERRDVDAVMVIDGTMLGERLGDEKGKEILNPDPYPVPLLNLYNDSHFQEASKLGTDYCNLSASKNAAEAYDVVIRNSGHLNFTDLPLFSPALARMLGTGNVDSRTCIETMNRIALEFFNHALKNAPKPDIKAEY